MRLSTVLPGQGLRCVDFVEVVTDYLEGTMPRRRRRRVEGHLRACDGCDEYLAQLRRMIELTGQLRAADLDGLGPEARARLVEAFRTARTGL